mmetsp:Transcript_81805/g.162349  ORF Transcript_81805/g.162349 Transcript_81805/m.162349 type:complete len:85 (+) Transcript_81805:1069-1323(+)
MPLSSHSGIDVVVCACGAPGGAPICGCADMCGCLPWPPLDCLSTGRTPELGALGYEPTGLSPGSTAGEEGGPCLPGMLVPILDL